MNFLKTKITIVGRHGNNLSRYLRDHLKEKGIRAHHVGVHLKNGTTRNKIENAKAIIFIDSEIKKEVEIEIDITGKKVICLDVSDNPLATGDARSLTGEIWLEYQKNYTYPKLEESIKAHLKILQKIK